MLEIESSKRKIKLLKQYGATDNTRTPLIIYSIIMLLFFGSLFLIFKNKSDNKLLLILVLGSWSVIFIFSLFLIKAIGYVIMASSVGLFFLSAQNTKISSGWSGLSFIPISFLLLLPAAGGYCIVENSTNISEFFFHTHKYYLSGFAVFGYVTLLVWTIGSTIYYIVNDIK